MCTPTDIRPFVRGSDGFTDATSNSGRVAGAWLKTAEAVNSVRIKDDAALIYGIKYEKPPRKVQYFKYTVL